MNLPTKKGALRRTKFTVVEIGNVVAVAQKRLDREYLINFGKSKGPVLNVWLMRAVMETMVELGIVEIVEND